MGYHFNGFFAQADQVTLHMALKQWPFCRGRVITEPFFGIGVTCPDPDRADTDEAAETMLDQIAAVAEGVLDWSKNVPSALFLYLEVDCFGGNCLYDGYVCRDGVLLDQEHSTGKSLRESRDGFRRLLQWLDVQTPTAFFAPLERGFFDHG